MKYKSKRRLRVLTAWVLTLCLTVGMFGSLPVLAQQASEAGAQLSGQKWTPDEEIRLNTVGDMSLEELSDAVLPESDKPELVGEAAIAEKGHVHRLREQEPDLNTVVFQNRDGTKTMYQYGGPVKYIDEAGQVRDKKTELSTAMDKAEYAADYGYVNSENDIRTYFPKSLNRSKGIVLEYRDEKIELLPAYKAAGERLARTDAQLQTAAERTADGAAEDVTAQTDLDSRMEAVASSPLKKQVTAESGRNQDTVEYAGVFGQDTTLRYTPTFQGFKEDILLHDRGAENAFTFRVKTGGLTLVKEEGRCFLVDPLTGETVVNVGDIIVYDSGEAASADTAAAEYDHYYLVEPVTADQEYLITIVVDAAYLESEDRVYPVTVDPSFEFNHASSAIKDAILYNGGPAYNVAHGSNWDQYIGYYNSTYGVGRLLVKFPGLTDSALFESLDESEIVGVSFHMWQYRTSTTPANLRAYLYDGAAWTETTVKCSNAGWNDYTAVTGMENVPVTDRAWYSFNIKPAALLWKDWSHDPAKGLMIRNSNETDSGSYKVFNSTEWGSTQNSSQMPYIQLTWQAEIPVGIQSNSVYYIQNACSGKYLDVKEARIDNNSSIIQNNLTGDLNQKFQLVRDSATGYYRIFAQHTTLTRVLLLNTSNNVVLSDDCSSDRALWRIKNEGGGRYSFINKTNESTQVRAMSNMSSAASGTVIRSEEYVYTSNLCWRLTLVNTDLLETFSDNDEELGQALNELDGFLNDYLTSISPPRYCGNVEITSSNKDSMNCQGQNIYLFLYNWYEEHIWPYERELPQWYNSAHNPSTAEGAKRAALDDWSQKIYGSTTWEGIINGFDNYVDALYYELADIGNTLTSAVKQVIGGNYSEDVTIIGTTGQIALSFTGVDFVADVRDIIYDGTHWKWTWKHAGQTGIDLIALLPVIGAFKNLDELSVLVKNADSLAALAKNADEAAALSKKVDELVALAKQSGKFNDLARDTEMWAKVAAKSNGSNTVVLGKMVKNADGSAAASSYSEVAKKYGYSYFSLPDSTWDELYAVAEYEGMWKINEKYLDMQIDAQKSFVFSHNPYDFQDEVSSFGRELRYIKNRGYTFSAKPNAHVYYEATKK